LYGNKIAERIVVKIFLLISIILAEISIAQEITYPWTVDTSYSSSDIISDIQTPDGYERIQNSAHSFALWLRYLPLKKTKKKVLLHDGREKGNQTAHYRIINIDTGSQDLQQCADAVIRLRAEYLYFKKHFSAIHFNFTSGDRAGYAKWMQGFRPQVKNNKVSWKQTAGQTAGYKIFRKYLKTVFIYAGSHSLSKEMISVPDVSDMKIGDVFIQGGFPGHAVIVVDMAEKSGKEAFLLAQSYMPAQEIHILKNPSNSKIGPWFIIKETDKLYTPEWTFEWSDLKRFKE
jgi:hypothetical protein